MERDSAPATAPPADAEVMASIDTDADGPRFVIADITADDTWMSIRERSAASLAEWR